MTTTHPAQIDLPGAIITAATEAAQVDATAALSLLAEAAQLVDDLTRDYVARARREGRSWQQLGTVLGITEEAARQRYEAAR